MRTIYEALYETGYTRDSKLWANAGLHQNSETVRYIPSSTELLFGKSSVTGLSISDICHKSRSCQPVKLTFAPFMKSSPFTVSFRPSSLSQCDSDILTRNAVL